MVMDGADRPQVHANDGHTLPMELKKIDTITTITVLLNESFIGITLHIPTVIGIDYIKTNNSIY